MSKYYGIAAGFTFTKTAGASNIAEVKIQVVDADGNAVEEVFNFLFWLSDAATGAGLTGTSASGTVTAKTSCGAVLSIPSAGAKKASLVQTLADGSFTLEITDSAKTAFYVCAMIPSGPNNGRCQVDTVLATANYG